MSERQQRMMLQGESSCWLDINAGGPQGSGLKMYNQELPNIPYSKHLGVTLQQKLNGTKTLMKYQLKQLNVWIF